MVDRAPTFEDGERLEPADLVVLPGG